MIFKIKKNCFSEVICLSLTAQGLVVLQMTSDVIQANPFHWTSELFRALALQSSCYFLGHIG